jgi:hypothetical protein
VECPSSRETRGRLRCSPSWAAGRAAHRTHQAAAAGADRRPNRHFLPARETPGQQSIADTGTGDEKNREDDDKRDAERWQQCIGIVEGVLPQWEEPDAATAVRLRIRRFQTRGDRQRFRLCLINRHFRLEPHVSFDPSGAAIFQLVDAHVELRPNRLVASGNSCCEDREGAR